MIKKLQQAGDTIIEVMFAVAVVGVTIASAYGVATLSLRNARQAQERGEALKIAESQIESLRAIAASDTGTDRIFDTTPTQELFCLSSGSTLNEFGALTEIPPVESDDFNQYPTVCNQGLYYTAIDVTNGSSANLKEYQVTVRWDSLGSDNKNEVQMRYTLFKP